MNSEPGSGRRQHSLKRRSSYESRLPSKENIWSLAVMVAALSVLGALAVGCGDSSTSSSREFVSISSRLDYNCGVLADGDLICWGDEERSYGTPPQGEYKSVSLGMSYACGVRTDDSVACWGEYESWQPPPQPTGKFASVSAGSVHACGVRTDNELVCWGSDVVGRATPPRGEFASVSAGVYHTCGVKTDGTLACWGSDTYGQSTPPPGKFASVSAGIQFTCGVRTDSSMVCWGHSRPSPYTPLSGKFDSVNARGWRACGVRIDGSVTCGQLDDRIPPPPGPFKTISETHDHICGILVEGTVECWGRGWKGQTTLPWERFDAASCDSEVAERFGRPSPHWPPSQEDWPVGGDLRGIEFSLDVLAEETVKITLTARNITNETISWFANAHYFLALRVDDCTQVWRDDWGNWMNYVNAELGPFEERVWSSEWERETDSGDLVKPGEYLIYARFTFQWNVGPPEDIEEKFASYASLPHELEFK